MRKYLFTNNTFLFTIEVMQGFHDTDLIRACRILFGSHIDINPHFLRYLQLSGVKSAYRKRALDTHPDRCVTLGDEHQRRSTELFLEVTHAYEKICAYVNTRTKLFQFNKGYADKQYNFDSTSGTGRKKRQKRKESGRNDTHQKSKPRSSRTIHIPKRPLKIGEFLYFSGRISWKSLISAITSQRMGREKIGEIANRWGWLTGLQIETLLKYRRLGEKLGDVLIRNELISSFQLNMLLHQQRKTQTPLGEYLIDEKTLTDDELRNYLLQLKEHNNKYGE